MCSSSSGSSSSHSHSHDHSPSPSSASYHRGNASSYLATMEQQQREHRDRMQLLRSNINYERRKLVETFSPGLALHTCVSAS